MSLGPRWPGRAVIVSMDGSSAPAAAGLAASAWLVVLGGRAVMTSSGISMVVLVVVLGGRAVMTSSGISMVVLVVVLGGRAVMTSSGISMVVLVVVLGGRAVMTSSGISMTAGRGVAGGTPSDRPTSGGMSPASTSRVTAALLNLVAGRAVTISGVASTAGFGAGVRSGGRPVTTRGGIRNGSPITAPRGRPARCGLAPDPPW